MNLQNRKPHRWWFHVAAKKYRLGEYEAAYVSATDAMQTSNYRRWLAAKNLRDTAWHRMRVDGMNKIEKRGGYLFA